MKIAPKVSIFLRSHWLDVSIFASLALLLVGFFLFFYRKAEYITIKVKVTDQEVLSAFRLPNNMYALQFQKGDTERDAVGRVVSELTAVDSYALDATTRVIFLTLKVRSTYDVRTKLYSARGKTLMYGTPMRFNLSNVTFDGYVTEVQNGYVVNSVDKKIKMKAIVRGLNPDITPKVKEGDIVYDSQGRELVKIVSVTVTPALQVTQNSAGQLLKAYNPLVQDVSLELEVAGKLINGKDLLAFTEVPAITGSTIPINTERYSIFPEVQEVESN